MAVMPTTFTGFSGFDEHLKCCYIGSYLQIDTLVAALPKIFSQYFLLCYKHMRFFPGPFDKQNKLSVLEKCL